MSQLVLSQANRVPQPAVSRYLNYRALWNLFADLFHTLSAQRRLATNNDHWRKRLLIKSADKPNLKHLDIILYALYLTQGGAPRNVSERKKLILMDSWKIFWANQRDILALLLLLARVFVFLRADPGSLDWSWSPPFRFFALPILAF
jgi:hypothetical protein